MLTTAEVSMAQAMLEAVQRLLAAMAAAGVRDPVACVRQVLQLNFLSDAADYPLLFWATEDPLAVAWAGPVRDVLVTFDLAQAGALPRRAVEAALGTVQLFQDVRA